MTPAVEWSQAEIDYHHSRGTMIVDRLSRGLSIDLDPVTLDRVAEALRAAEPSAQSRRDRRRCDSTQSA